MNDVEKQERTGKMSGKLQFREKLSGILDLANENNKVLSVEDVEKYFEEDCLSEEQMELVYDYLMAQKIAVKGYEKTGGTILSAEEQEEKLAEEDRMYVQEYLEEIAAMQPHNKAEEQLKEYSPKVVEIAVEMYSQDYMIEDLIQEGNVGLMMSLEAEDISEQQILSNIRQAMMMMIKDDEETKIHDKKMIEKVAYLDECVKNLKEDLGRKPTLDEVAVYMGLTEDEVNDILRLTGEEDDEEEEA